MHLFERRGFVICSLFVSTAVFWMLPGSALAGGGPENVALVVNEDNWASLSVANEYIQLRNIPARNVMYLPGEGLDRETITIDVFRDKILRPLVKEVSRRGLQSQIDYVVYSAGFPFAIDVRADLEGDTDAARLPKFITKKASINGLTFLYESVLAKDWRSYLSLQSNSYANASGQGFRSQYGWSSSGAPLSATQGRRYVLSTVLAVTSGRGNSIDEVSNYLTRAASADATHPQGTIYLMENNNVRSETREWAFSRTVSALARLGVTARIETGRIPSDRNDVMGAVVGTARFDWAKSNSVILPGAICEHLTSLGGDLRSKAGQTPLSEFLRHGAAGASGTVTEPYALQAKFPTPLIHVSYASGCSLAESFYQSVAGPYQLLIVGDPLCQPWAKPPTLAVTGIEPGGIVSGQGTLSVSATARQGVRRVELFLDGKRLGEYPATFTIPIDTTLLWDGPHELRAVAIANDKADTQGRIIIPFNVANKEDSEEQPTEATVPEEDVELGDELQVESAVPGSDLVAVFSGARMVGQLSASSGTLSVSTQSLGTGGFNLRVVGFKNGKEVAERRVKVKVRTPKTAPASKAPDETKRKRGLLLEAEGESRVIEDLNAQLDDIKPGTRFNLRGWYHAKTAGTYQLQLHATKHITSARVNKRVIRFKKNAQVDNQPLKLSAGWYEIRLSGKVSEKGLPEIRFGQANILPLAADRLWFVE